MKQSNTGPLLRKTLALKPTENWVILPLYIISN